LISAYPIILFVTEIKSPIHNLKMKYYIIAGEASGDLHGSNLMKALLRKDST
jgi:hypothetical protein